MIRVAAVKSEEQQERATLYRARETFGQKRPRMINAPRGHIAEHGIVAPMGKTHLERRGGAP